MDGQSYKIDIKKDDIFKTRNGSSVDYAIPLLHAGGVIDRFERVNFDLQIKIPPFFKQSSINNIDLKVDFISED